ncbi:uncharacterized protein FOMMEDRAFT_157730 [Fomitiporia mediterranea MF3/22]|uniref:uncharacterized protein n=1 Tax=Fomitiporia mediterranea (strain MF3/22) TaxID=694068 RepID=UPI000440771C|nr:uncharacterized protein FOMMEDRAFT_157730 [Fomitiporia mediterranea MF3/22]EJD02507.1 hypothetical protein FOMMEDRAFT_157730 [Fomitiporia mediterranea MF3/22]
MAQKIGCRRSKGYLGYRRQWYAYSWGIIKGEKLHYAKSDSDSTLASGASRPHIHVHECLQSNLNKATGSAIVIEAFRSTATGQLVRCAHDITLSPEACRRSASLSSCSPTYWRLYRRMIMNHESGSPYFSSPGWKKVVHAEATRLPILRFLYREHRKNFFLSILKLVPNAWSATQLVFASTCIAKRSTMQFRRKDYDKSDHEESTQAPRKVPLYFISVSRCERRAGVADARKVWMNVLHGTLQDSTQLDHKCEDDAGLEVDSMLTHLPCSIQLARGQPVGIQCIQGAPKAFRRRELMIPEAKLIRLPSCQLDYPYCAGSAVTLISSLLWLGAESGFSPLSAI